MLSLLALPWSAALAQTIANPGFESNSFSGTVAANSAITGWTAAPTDHVGLNQLSGTYANNGAVPQGSNVAFITANTPPAVTTLGTTITGLTVGTRYNVSFRINARAAATANLPFLTVSADAAGADPMSMEIAAISTAANTTAVYKYAAYEFTATATSHVLTLSSSKTGDNTALVDDFKIAPSTGAWKYRAWTGDADSGISTNYNYTHAFNFGPTTIPNYAVNGVPFISKIAAVTGSFSTTALTSTFANFAGNALGGDSAHLANDFRFNGAPGTTNSAIVLSGLKPSTKYVASFYGTGFDLATSTTPYRAATFGSSLTTEMLTVDLDHYGYGNGLIVDYTYTTDTTGTVTITYPATGSGSFHTSAFSNREFATAPATPQWTATAWNDDASSGVDGTFPYTFALNFNTATSQLVNGVNFTGVAGANPAGPGLTTTFPSVATDSSNMVTGNSTGLAKTFVYNGQPAYFNLTGLTPGKGYVFTAYSVGWDAQGGRQLVFMGSEGGGLQLVDQDNFGLDYGIKFQYAYTANAAGAAKIVVFSWDGADTFHCYAASNRAADALVATAPVITQQPVGATLAKGKDLTLTVGVTGSPTITYQWKKDGVNISGATSSTLTLSNLAAANAGSYTVAVHNSSGDVTSSAAVVAVRDNIPGVFGTGLAPDGTPLTGGSIDPHFTLKTNADPLSDPTSTTVYVESNVPGAWYANNSTSMWVGPRADTTLTGVSSQPDRGEGAGVYVYSTTVDLTNFDLSTVVISGGWAADNAGLNIRVNGAATNQTATGLALLSTFSISTTNAPSLVAGVNVIDFVMRDDPPDSLTAIGFTGLRVDGMTAVGVLLANKPPHIVRPPQSVTAGHLSDVILSGTSSGSGTLSYQWYRNNVIISGETGEFLHLIVDSAAVGGTYKVKVTNAFGSVESSPATVTVANSNPIAGAYSSTINQGQALTLGSFDLTDVSSDPDNDPIDVTAVSAKSAANGSVTLSGGTIVYTPLPSFSGTDTFTYTITDGVWGGSATGTVTVTVTPTTTPPPTPIKPVFTIDAGPTPKVSFTGTAGVSYTFQRSSDLVNWTNLQTTVAPAGGAVQFSDSTPPAGKAFYRVSY